MQTRRNLYRGFLSISIRAILVLMLILPGFLPVGQAQASGLADHAYPMAGNIIRISQFYGGGGGSTGYYKNDYAELFNSSASAINLTGWSLQYGSSTGNFGSSSSNIYAFPDGTMIQAGKYLMIQLGSVGTGGIAFPVTPDLVTTNLNMAAASGKVALAKITTSLGCGATASPCVLPHINIEDLASYGASNNAEGGVPVNNGVALTNQQGGVRKGGGCQDTDVNNDDYDVVTGSSLIPRNSSSPENLCGIEPIPVMTVSKTAPERIDINEQFDYTITVGNRLGITATQVVITDSLPLSVTFVSASDGGQLIDTNTVSWTIPTLADADTALRTVTVAAPAAETTLVNEDYGVWASNWITRTVGIEVTTNVHDPEIITPIAEARAAGPGWYGTIQGNVTVTPATFYAKSFAIQDDTGGLYVFPASSFTLPPMELGDVVRVIGEIKNYNNLLEIDPVESVTWIDTGQVPEPLVTQTGFLAPTQGKLIQIEGTALSISGTGSNKTIYFNDGSGQTQVYVYGYTGIDLSSFSYPMPMRVIGLSSHYGANTQIQPRYQSDMIDLRAPAVTATNPVNGAIDVNLYRSLSATFSKSMDPASFNLASFSVAGEAGPIMGTIDYDDGTHTASYTPSNALLPFSVYTATLTTDVKDIYGIALVSSYTWSFTTGAEDTTPPSIVSVSPLADATEVPLTANVVITFTEDINPASLDSDHFILQGPFGTVPFILSYDAINYVVTLNPVAKFLATTVYTATVSGNTADWAGLTLGADYTWSFETSVEPPMEVYFGDIHNHTSFSDGAGTPEEALAAGEAAGYSFMAISDHSYAIDDGEWEATEAAVEAATSSSFVALRGFEYTQGAEGHINVFNTVRHAVRTNTGCGYCDYTPNLEQGVTVEGFYHWLSTQGLIGLDEAGTVMQFNHPGWINFNDWTYHPEVSDVARMEEVGNGNGTSYAFSEDQYIRSLDYGWKVGASNNADTHTTYWGTNTDHRTGVLMAGLTKESLLEALRERRTFATEDKNFELTMKANGAWMGSEIANSGWMQFEITVMDPDGEQTALVDIVTDQGKVVEQIGPASSEFTWYPSFAITSGVHYFYVRVTQADGDRIVSSPVWTLGSEDISITDLTIQPSIPTTNNPSLLNVRVTNRNTDARTVTVSIEANGTPIGTPIVVNVPGNADGFASFSWQPTGTGEAVVTAQITDTPIGDNPDDNTSVLHLTVTDEQLPLVLVDAGHGNLNAVGNEMQMFFNDLSDHQYNVLKNLDTLTAADLNPAVVKLLLITAPQTAYTSAELTAIADYIAAGGSLWLCGVSDYSTSLPWAATAADKENSILAAIETRTGTQINMRINDDEIIDGNNNNGYVFGPIWSNFPSENDTSIGINVDALASWSVASLRGRTKYIPLTADTQDVQIVIQGDLDTGYTQYGSYWDPNHTANTDADSAGDAYIYNPSWVYPNFPDEVPPGAITVPMAAVTQLPNGAGRILLYGDSNDAFTTYAYTAGDGKQNELFNLEAAMWLMGEPLQKSTIAEARAQAEVNQPDNLDKLVWVEGYITAAYGEFFNVLYVQDETGGITVHAPAGDIDPTVYTRGTHVRVVGTIGIYNGDTEIEFFEAEMVQVIDLGTGEPQPLSMSTNQASLEENQGWLAVISGTVTSKIGEDTLFVDDGSGPVRIFLDGYNGNFADINGNDLVRVTGLVSEDGDGQRIRVRNHGMHPGIADDVMKLPQTLELGISKTAATPEMVLPGSLVTYTLVLSNTGSGLVLETTLTDALPAELTFGGFVQSGGANEQDGTITWAGNMPVGMAVNIIFTATVDTDYSLYGETINNTVQYATAYLGGGSAEAAFTIASPPDILITKSVIVPSEINLGEPVTYTISLSNFGEAPAIDVLMTDTLPTELAFGEWILQNGAVEENGVITWAGDLVGARQFIFTALVNYDSNGYGQPIHNIVEYSAANTNPGGTIKSFFIGTPELSITKSVETMHDPAMPGEPLTYTVVVQNAGNTGAVGVLVVDLLPAYVIGDYLYETVDINANTSQTFTIPATLASDVPLGSTIINTASYENGNLSGEASVSFDVGQPILTITKSVDLVNDPAHPGDPITYTIVVRNDGNADVTGVHIVDTLPDEVIGEDVDEMVDINVGTAYTITVPAVLSPDAVLGSTITNTAFYEWGDLNGEASVSFDVWLGAPVLSILKTVELANDPARPGDPITYTIVVSNAGTADAINVHIYDTLPPGVIGEDVDITETISVGEVYTITIAATLAMDVVRGSTITNTAYFIMGECYGESSASFTVAVLNKIYLPILRR